MVRRPQLVRSLFKIVVIGFLVVAAIAVIYMPILANNIADDISARYRGQVVIKEASLSPFGPRLTFRGVIIENPSKYPQGQAIEIETVTVNFNGYSDQPLHVQSVIFDGVMSYPQFVDSVDNLSIIQRNLMTRNKMMPQGIWAKPAIVETIQIRHAQLNAEALNMPLKDKNLDPVGNNEDPLMLDHVMTKILDDVIQAQRDELPKLVLESVKEKAIEAIDSITRKLRGLNE